MERKKGNKEPHPKGPGQNPGSAFGGVGFSLDPTAENFGFSGSHEIRRFRAEGGVAFVTFFTPS